MRTSQSLERFRHPRKPKSINEEVIHIVCRLHCAPENSEAVEKLVLALVEPARQEEGCAYYRAFRVRDKVGEFFLEDGWKDEAAIARRLEHPNVIRVMRELSPLLLQKPEPIYSYCLA